MKQSSFQLSLSTAVFSHLATCLHLVDDLPFEINNDETFFVIIPIFVPDNYKMRVGVLLFTQN